MYYFCKNIVNITAYITIRFIILSKYFNFRYTSYIYNICNIIIKYIKHFIFKKENFLLFERVLYKKHREQTTKYLYKNKLLVRFV